MSKRLDTTSVVYDAVKKTLLFIIGGNDSVSVMYGDSSKEASKELISPSNSTFWYSKMPHSLSNTRTLS